MFEITKIMFRPHLDLFMVVCRLPNTELTVVMWCHIFDRKSIAPSSGDFRRRSGRPVNQIGNFE